MKLRLILLTREDRNQLMLLLRDYTSMVREALELIIGNDIRSMKKAHEICYRVLREKYPYLHNKFAEEAYKRALAMYRSYRKLLNRWRRISKKRKDVSPPSPPKVEGNRVIELHINTYRLERDHGFLVLKISKGNGIYVKFLVMEYEYTSRELEKSRIGNSRILIDGGEIYLLLTIRRDVDVGEHRNKLVVDINEDSVDALLVDYDANRAILFTIGHDIRAIRTNYRRIRKGIQIKVKDPYKQRRLLAKYGSHEKHREEDRLKKIAVLLAEIAREHSADIVRENLKDLKTNSKRRNKQLNYRLSAFPYRKLIIYLDLKAYERGINVVEVDAKKSSITCPICGFTNKRNRIDRETFRCRKCGFTFNAQYVACLNLYSRLNDGRIAIRGGRITIIVRETGSVVPVNVAPDELLKEMRRLRGKPMSIESQVIRVA